ncbi:hypothetical protein MY5147_006346 [Beauveria neobassiana]|uniref:Cutinase n=2 Tax=Beauveria bassiana TaxID=176275 RepID=A0A0A2VVV6_BEABA|nr:Cutinase [Beauveria bassiana D1-5]PQK17892.1 hypothetical protein BB8028_0009g00930 [Beauveria bassiana]
MQPLNLFLTALFGTSALAVPTSLDYRYSDLEQRGADANKIVGWILNRFPGEMTVNAACSFIKTSELLLGTIFGIPSDFNNSGCKDVLIVFARGTCDPGNSGILVAPPFIDAVRKAIGDKSLGVQGVAYPASVDGYLNAHNAAGLAMAQIVRETRASCPNTKIVLSGYSQGAFAPHYAADALGAEMRNVSAVVTFGDPMSSKPVANMDAKKSLCICHLGDDICDQGNMIFPQHLTYGIDATHAAAFVASNM